MIRRRRNAVPAGGYSRPGQLSSDLALYQDGQLRPLQLYERLTGPRQTWWGYCQEAARGTVAQLGDEELSPAFEVVGRKEPVQGAGAVTGGIRAVHAVSRALALDGDRDGDQRSLVSEAASRWRSAPAAPSAAPGPPFSAAAALARVPVQFQDRTRSVLSLLDQPQHDAGEAMVAICALMLAGAQPSAQSTAEVRVVLAVRQEGRVEGVTARLKVRELPGGPAGLFPDPEALMVQPNEAFDRALRLAWKVSEGDKQRRCVLWRITPDSDVPGYGIDGGSLGAAFAIALQQLLRRRPSSRLLSLATLGGFLARLRPNCVITGELSDQRPAGQARQLTQRGPWLVKVGEMDAKLSAAGAQHLRLVAPAANKPTAGHEIPADVHVYWATTLRQADRYARRVRPVRTAVTGFALLAAIGGSVGPALAVHYDNTARAQHAQAQRAQDTATANQLATEAAQVSGTDPELAAQLLLTAYRLSQQSPDFAWRLVSTESQTLSTSLNTSSGSAVVATAFSPNGAILAAAADNGGRGGGGVTLWDVGGPGPPRRLSEPITASNGPSAGLVAFSPKGATFAASSGGNVTLWDVSDPARPRQLGQPLTTIDGSPAGSVAFSPDGATVAVGGDRGATLWDVSDPARPRQVGQALSANGGRVAFSPDGRTLAIGGDNFGGGVTLWDVSNPARPRQLGQSLNIGTGEPVVSMVFSPGGATLAASSGGDVLLWDVSDPARPRQLGPPLLAGRVASLAFSPSGATLAAASDVDDGPNGSVDLWDVSDPARPRPLGQSLTAATLGPVDSVAFGPDGATLAAGGDGVTLWDAPSAGLPSSAAVSGSSVVAVAFSPNSATLAAATDDNADQGGEVTLWDVSRPAEPRELGLPLAMGGAAAVAFSRNGATLAVATWNLSGGGVTLWDVSDPARPRQLSQPLPVSSGTDAPSVAFSPRGATLAIGGDSGVTLWDVSNPAQPRQLSQPFTTNGADVKSVAFSPNGTTIAASGDGGVTLWDVSNPARPRQLSQPFSTSGAAVNSMAFSRNGSTIAVGAYNYGGGGATLWDVSNPAKPRQLRPFSQTPATDTADRVVSMAFSPDDATLALATATGGVTVWDVSDPGQPRELGATLTTNGAVVNSIAFSPNGAALAVGADSTKVWDLNTGDAISRICDLIGGGLTRQQWSQYMPELQYDPPCASYR